jgi:hypothetical protein
MKDIVRQAESTRTSSAETESYPERSRNCVRNPNAEVPYCISEMIADSDEESDTVVDLTNDEWDGAELERGRRSKRESYPNPIRHQDGERHEWEEKRSVGRRTRVWSGFSRQTIVDSRLVSPSASLSVLGGRIWILPSSKRP